MYLAVKNRVRHDETTWARFLGEAFAERPVELTDDFMKRLGRGVSRRGQYAQMAKQFELEFPVEAEVLALELSSYLPVKEDADAWDRLLEEYGAYGALRTINPEALGLSRRDAPSSQERPEIKLGEPYCFSLSSESEAIALLMERHEQGDWHPIALGRTEKDWHGALTAGENLLPWNSDENRPFVLREHADIGVREFVLVLSDQETLAGLAKLIAPNKPLTDAWLHRLAEALMAEEIPQMQAHRLDVVFVA